MLLKSHFTCSILEEFAKLKQISSQFLQIIVDCQTISVQGNSLIIKGNPANITNLVYVSKLCPESVVGLLVAPIPFRYPGCHFQA